jgi:hypothetical protein
MASSFPVVIASDQAAVPASQSGTWNMRLQDGAGSAVNKGQGVMTASLPVVIASDQSALNIKLQDGAGSAVNKGQGTMAASLPVVISSDQSTLNVQQIGKAKANTPVFNDYASTGVTTAAYVQMVASTTSACTAVECYNQSGSSLYFATGAGGAEVNQFVIPPGGNGPVVITIAASTRISVKAVDTSVSIGSLILNFWS